MILLSLRHQPAPQTPRELESVFTRPGRCSLAIKTLTKLKRKQNLLNPQSQEGKLPSFKGLLKTKKSCSRVKKEKKKKREKKKRYLHMNEPVLYFIPLNFMLSDLFANNSYAMKGKIRNKRTPSLAFHHQGIMVAIWNFTGAEALRHVTSQPVFQHH